MYRKIDLFSDGKYIFSTNQSKTCKDAKNKLLRMIETNNIYGYLKNTKILAKFAY